MFFAAPLAVAAVAGVASAAPLEDRSTFVTVPLTYVMNVAGMADVYAHGRARLDKINGRTSVAKRSASGTITNVDVSYVATVDIGGKAQTLIVDTGSSNTWCGADDSTCEPTSTGKSTGDKVAVDYGSGSFSGTEYTDEVEFAGLTVTSQSIGSASTSSGFSGVDGIIGFGPEDLTEDTVSGVSEVPTFMQNLYSQGSISENVLGVSFRPESGSSDDSANGELTLGGVDTTKYSGTLTYFSKLTSGLPADYWGIEVAKFAYGTTSLETDVDAIVDTGTTLIYIPETAYDAFLKAAGGTTGSSGLATFTTEPTSDFYITFGSTEYSLTPSQYLIPTDQYSYYGLSSGKYYSWIANGGSGSSSENVVCIIGQKFIEQYYSVFDTTNSRIGFATGV